MAAMEGLHRLFTSDSAAARRVLPTAGAGCRGSACRSCKRPAGDLQRAPRRVPVSRHRGARHAEAIKVWILALALFLHRRRPVPLQVARPRLPAVARGGNPASGPWRPRIQFDAGERSMPVKATLHHPGPDPRLRHPRRELRVPRLRIHDAPTLAGGRQVQWAIRRAKGPQTLYYRAVVYKDPTAGRERHHAAVPDGADARRAPRHGHAGSWWPRCASQSADPASFTVELLKRLARLRRRPERGAAARRCSPSPWTARARAAMTVLAAAQHSRAADARDSA